MSAPYPISADGIWIEQLRPVVQTERVFFCDRDGVIIYDRGYLADPTMVELINGIVPILKAVEHAGIPTVIVTNQSGIGRNYFNWAAFAAVQARMLDLLAAAGVQPSIVIACPYHPNANSPYRHPNHSMRKPNPGMLLAASALYRINPAASLMIGDKIDDMRAAKRAGLRCGILVQEDFCTPIEFGREPTGTEARFSVTVTANLRAATPAILKWID